MRTRPLMDACAGRGGGYSRHPANQSEGYSPRTFARSTALNDILKQGGAIAPTADREPKADVIARG